MPFDVLPTPVYSTRNGACYIGDSRELLRQLPEECIDLVVTSPPFALLRQKAYGNKDQAEYVDWLCGFGAEVRRVLRETGSFVLDLGGAYHPTVFFFNGVPNKLFQNGPSKRRFAPLPPAAEQRRYAPKNVHKPALLEHTQTMCRAYANHVARYGARGGNG